MATELFDRWSAGKLGPAPLESGVFDDIDDSDDEIDLDDGAAGTGIVRIQRLSDGARQLMRGIITERTNRVSHRLDPNDPNKRDAAIFGDNGLTVGQWWPYQICALRDGAHGARQGGIYGREVEGTYSIVTSAESKYSDTDRGDSLYYSGSHDDPVNDNDTAAQLTKNTRLLMRSITTRRPVRVIRKGPGKRNSYYPRCGFRYDGLYRVVSYNIESGSGGQRDFYQFHLVRCPGQVPLTDPSVAGHPSRSEYELYLELTGRR